MSNRTIFDKLIDGAEVEWVPLGELGTLVNGNGLPKADFTESGVPAIHYGQIYTHYGLSTTSTISFVSQETAKKLKKVDTGDVIITSPSEKLEDVATPLVYLGKEQAVTGQDSIIFKPGGKILGKYFAFFTQTASFEKAKRRYAIRSKVIRVYAKDLSKMLIPIPSIEKQKEIVRILDTFDKLKHSGGEGLLREIELRQKQYNYYREQLFDCKKLLDGAEMEWKMLGDENFFEIANKERRQVKAYLRVPGDYPYHGGNNIQDYVEGYTHDGEFVLIAITGAASLSPYSTQYATGKFWASGNVHVIAGKSNVDTRYIYYALSTVNFIPFLIGTGRMTLTKAKLINIPVPIPCPDDPTKSLTIQREIVRILDTFDKLKHSGGEGLLREIELRQKQYDYYREQLFNCEE